MILILIFLMLYFDFWSFSYHLCVFVRAQLNLGLVLEGMCFSLSTSFESPVPIPVVQAVTLEPKSSSRILTQQNHSRIEYRFDPWRLVFFPEHRFQKSFSYTWYPISSNIKTSSVSLKVNIITRWIFSYNKIIPE